MTPGVLLFVSLTVSTHAVRRGSIALDDEKTMMTDIDRLTEQREQHPGEDLTKNYPSFAEYVLENSQTGSSLPVPVVKSVGKNAILSIPIITIIGAQKAGTSNLRGNLMTHPMVSGVRKEMHFFDQDPSKYENLAFAQWEGDGLDHTINNTVAGEILSAYAKTCGSKVVVDSSPRYSFDPLAPYIIHMVRPGAKFVIVLRDPTDRYFSQLQMNVCRDKAGITFAAWEKKMSIFHRPGEAKAYLARAEIAYQPYTALCRGENASSSDLWSCYEAINTHNPLYRGLYADQLERWFRVFGRSQIMVIDSSDMWTDFTAVVATVAEFAGLPQHSFTYDDSHEYRGGGCDKPKRRRHAPDFFDEGGRYDKMIKEADIIREWYQPHNERLYELLGREPMWL